MPSKPVPGECLATDGLACEGSIASTRFGRTSPQRTGKGIGSKRGRTTSKETGQKVFAITGGKRQEVLTPQRKKVKEEVQEMPKGIRKAPPTKFPPTAGGRSASASQGPAAKKAGRP